MGAGTCLLKFYRSRKSWPEVLVRISFAHHLVIPYDITSRDLAHLVVSALKVSFEGLNPVKSYGKSNMGVFTLRLWENIQVGLNFF